MRANGSDPARPVKVVLVGIGVDPTAFSDFCRRHLIDYACGGERLNCFLLHGIRADAAPWRCYRLFGEWPRAFERNDDLRDTLAELVNDLYQNDSKVVVSLLILANQPSDLVDAELLEPLRERVAERPSERSRLWVSAAFLSGPGYQGDVVADLLGRENGLLLNAWLLGQHPGAAGQGFNPAHWTSLRSLVDIVADDATGWSGLRYRPNSGSTRLLWVQRQRAEQLGRLDEISSYVKSAFHVLWDEDIRESEQTATFRANVEDIVKGFRVAPETMADASPHELPELKDSDDYQPQALAAIDAYFQSFMADAKAMHKDMQARVRAGITSEYGPSGKRLRDLAEAVARLRIPNGGISDASRRLVDDKIAEVRNDHDAVLAKIREELRVFASQHRRLQNRPDPLMAGSLDDSLFRVGGYFDGIENRLRMAALELPTGFLSLVLVSIMAPSLVALVAIIHFQPLVRVATVGFVDMFISAMKTLGGVNLAILAVLLVTPLTLQLAFWRTFVRRERNVFAVARTAVQGFASYIKDAMSGAREYSLDARHALLTEELVRLLERRLNRVVFDELKTQGTLFFHAAEELHLDESDKVTIRSLAAARQPDLWFWQLAALRITAVGPGGAWEVRVDDGPVTTGARVAREETMAVPLVVPSFAPPDKVVVSMVPLVWQTDRDSSETALASSASQGSDADER